MSDSDSISQEIIAGYPRLAVENYCIIASSALLWFDFGLTFTTEVQRIWRRKFSGATVVFLFMRYAALIDRILFVLEILVWNSSDQTCGRIEHTDDVVLILNYLSFSAFTVLRVYGVWGRDWKPLLIVAPLSLVKSVLYMVESARYVPVQSGPPFGCIYSYTLPDDTLANFSIIAKSTTIASDAILIGLTWVKTFGINRDSNKLGVRTPLATLLLRDGTAYFIILLLIQIVTIISNQIGSSLTVWLVWPYFDQVFTVIFLSRFMLDLRGLYFADSRLQAAGADAGQATTFSMPHGFSDIRFTTSTVVGNLGATLSTTLSFSDLAPSDADDAHLGEEAPRDAAATAAAESGVEIVGMEKEMAEKGAWYEDELLEYTGDPFREGMKMPPGVQLGVAEINIEEVKEPLSPEGSQSASGSPV